MAPVAKAARGARPTHVTEGMKAQDNVRPWEPRGWVASAWRRPGEVCIYLGPTCVRL